MAELKFEEALAKLEKIVSQLEAGDLPLEKSLKVFEEGVKLARHCAQQLEKAEKKIEILRPREGGRMVKEEFPQERKEAGTGEGEGALL